MGVLTPIEGVALLKSHDLTSIGSVANEVTTRLHPENFRTYNIDRNINYTNVCTAVCDFCAFYRTPNSSEGYVLPREELLKKIAETVELGGDQILMQGGLHPKYKLEWYEELLHDIKRDFPQVNVHGFSPPELHHFTKVNNLTIREVLERLRAAGLGSIPGGGAEILVDRVRDEITRGKVMTDDWLNVMRVWHELGGRSTATMMFWSRRDSGGANRAPRTLAPTAGRDGRIYRVHLLDVSTRPHGHGGCTTFRSLRLPEDSSCRAVVSRQYPKYPIKLGDSGLENWPAGYALRCQRYG